MFELISQLGSYSPFWTFTAIAVTTVETTCIILASFLAYHTVKAEIEITSHPSQDFYGEAGDAATTYGLPAVIIPVVILLINALIVLYLREKNISNFNDTNQIIIVLLPLLIGLCADLMIVCFVGLINLIVALSDKNNWLEKLRQEAR